MLKYYLELDKDTRLQPSYNSISFATFIVCIVLKETLNSINFAINKVLELYFTCEN